MNKDFSYKIEKCKTSEDHNKNPIMIKIHFNCIIFYRLKKYKHCDQYYWKDEKTHYFYFHDLLKDNNITNKKVPIFKIIDDYYPNIKLKLDDKWYYAFEVTDYYEDYIKSLFKIDFNVDKYTKKTIKIN